MGKQFRMTMKIILTIEVQVLLAGLSDFLLIYLWPFMSVLDRGRPVCYCDSWTGSISPRCLSSSLV